MDGVGGTGGLMGSTGGGVEGAARMRAGEILL